MRTSRWTRFLLPLPLIATAAACSDDVSIDTTGDPSPQTATVNGAITGSMTYIGPHPCSANGHIIGNGIVLVFDRRNPPPPAGLAVTAVNFAVVVGDLLFASEPRWTGSTTYCPLEHGITDTITVTAPFQVGPLDAASYLIQSFYDYTGDFLPNFKFRELPEKGDVLGGDIDVAAALQPINQNPNYAATFESIDIGIPQKLAADAGPGTIPLFTLPPNGFVAQNVQVTVGLVTNLTRPYFYAEGMDAVSVLTPKVALTVTEAQSSAYYWQSKSTSCPNCSNSMTGIAGSQELSDPANGVCPAGGTGTGSCAPYYMPVLTIPQDIQTFSPPVTPLLSGEAGANTFEAGGINSKGVQLSGLPHLRLRFEGSDPQVKTAAASPFNMQLTPFTGTPSGGSFNVWQGEWLNPEGKLPGGGKGPIWSAQYIPDSVYKQSGGVPVPYFWPVVILSKLEDDPTHTLDPASLAAQGDATHPVVIMQGITLVGSNATSTATDNDSLFSTVSTSVFNPTAYISANGDPVVINQDHVTALIRPAVICFNTLFDENNSDKRGNIVTPYLTSESSDFSGSPAVLTPQLNSPVVPPDLLDNGDPARSQVTSLVKAPPGWTGPAGWQAGQPCTDPAVCGPAIPGCLPKGRYAINVVYPDGQAWTVPNEAGACTGTATGEGSSVWNQATCTLQPRPIIASQGPRAVVEIVGPTNPNNCTNKPGAVPPTPAICLPTSN